MLQGRLPELNEKIKIAPWLLVAARIRTKQPNPLNGIPLQPFLMLMKRRKDSLCR